MAAAQKRDSKRQLSHKNCQSFQMKFYWCLLSSYKTQKKERKKKLFYVLRQNFSVGCVYRKVGKTREAFRNDKNLHKIQILCHIISVREVFAFYSVLYAFPSFVRKRIKKNNRERKKFTSWFHHTTHMYVHRIMRYTNTYLFSDVQQNCWNRLRSLMTKKGD